MVGDRLISDFIRRLERFSSNKPKENQPTGYEPLAQAAKKISQIITNAEEKTVRALAATNPNDELGRVLAQIAMLIRGENEEVPGITKPEAKIAQAVYGARNLISQAEGTALEAAQNLSGTESTIQEIAAGRLQAISLQENLSPSLKSKDTLTPEGVVQIGKESLAKAGREIQGALASLQATAEPGTIPPILAALIKLSGTGEIPPISLENNPERILKPEEGIPNNRMKTKIFNIDDMPIDFI
ncbi:MAG: hypothetical protein VKK32_01030 [Candidatus Melainabacteria bacterium]|nr:hypothetical protein [Candidatus Melainabacteria bacterium]